MSLYYYKCKLVKIIDGDTIRVDINLGFDVNLLSQTVRMYNIDTPESRTRNKAEKVLGLAAKDRLTELLGNEFEMLSHGKGKYGRVLGTPYTPDGKSICEILVEEGHAVVYGGGKKTKVWA